MSNIRKYLRLMSNEWLLAQRDVVANQLASNVEFTTLSMGGKSVGQRTRIRVIDYADALADVLVERGIEGDDYTKPTRMVRARFS